MQSALHKRKMHKLIRILFLEKYNYSSLTTKSGVCQESIKLIDDVYNVYNTLHIVPNTLTWKHD